MKKGLVLSCGFRRTLFFIEKNAWDSVHWEWHSMSAPVVFPSWQIRMPGIRTEAVWEKLSMTHLHSLDLTVFPNGSTDWESSVSNCTIPHCVSPSVEGNT